MSASQLHNVLKSLRSCVHSTSPPPPTHLTLCVSAHLALHRTDGALQDLGIKSVSDLAKWKYAKWAHALTVLAAYERVEGGSR